MDTEQIPKRIFLEGGIVHLVIFALLSIFFFFELKEIPLGYLLGAVISLLNHAILYIQANIMLNAKLGVGAAPLTMGCYFTRFLLYGGGLFLALYLDYIEIKLFAWYTVFAAYLVIKALIFIRFGKYREKPKKEKTGDEVK